MAEAIVSTKPSVRLPRTFIPEKYSIHFSLIQLEEPFQFKGTNEILLNVSEASTQITLHAQNLKINKTLLENEGLTQEPLNVSLDEKNSTVTFTFKDQPKTGTKAILKIDFEGTLNEKLMGLYRSSYQKDGKKKYLAVTQMEPVDCRRVIPCWDEPDLKAVFEVSLVKFADHISISNMPIVEEKVLESNQVLVKFGPTPKMSSYLLAIIVGEFEFLESKTPEGVDLRIYLPPGKKEQGRFALNVATKALSFLTKYFGIEYPLPKSDLICISDFAAGAMENWGAVTYRDIKLLITEDSSLASKHGAARTICHELAHMWFGNLVTMKWWTHLWLNEGFARFTEFIAVNDIFPEWDIWSSFNVSVLGYAFSADSLQSSHPIEVEVNHPAEINEIFDAISYAKGASVLRMLATYLTQDVFLKGLRIYLEKFKYSNASTEDLWNALEDASKKPVAEIMNNWTKKTGYPLVTVEEQYNEDQTQIVGLKFSQQRYLRSVSVDTSVIWKIPIDYVTADAPNQPVSFLLSDISATVPLQTPVSSSTWIKLNVHQTGMYRVRYSDTMLERLKQPVIQKTLKNVDRLSIIGDAFAISGRGKFTNFLSLFEAFKNEHEFYVWSQISSIFSQLNSLFNCESFYPQFNKFTISIFQPLFQNVLHNQWDSTDSKDPLDGALRALCVSRLGYAGYPPVIEEARKRFNAYIVEKNSSALKSDFLLPVLKIVLENGTEKEFQTILSYYRSIDSPEEKRTILQILGFVPDEKLIQQVLEFSMSTEVRKNDISVPLSSVALNPKGRQLVWEFLKSNWDSIYKSFGEGQFLLASIIDSCTSRFTNEKAAEEIKQFFEAHPIPDAQRTILQSIETINTNASFLATHAQDIQTWLNENKY